MPPYTRSTPMFSIWDVPEAERKDGDRLINGNVKEK
jgi:hypothetical protein